MKILDTGFAIIESDTHISKWAEESGCLGHDLNALPKILAEINPGDYVVDVGAFIGDHTLPYAEKVGSTGRVIAIEPNLEAYECLLHNSKLTRNEIVCYNFALSDKQSKCSLKKSPNAGASHLREDENGEIPTYTLDELVEGLHRLDFIKVDCEGYEVKMLNGARKCIAEHRPVLYIEVNEGALNRQNTSGAELFKLIESLGYRIVPTGSGPQYDVFCYPL
jgi:FkbM family methyltransferase